jgi:Ca2+-binding EF-hand superfamily protein
MRAGPAAIDYVVGNFQKGAFADILRSLGKRPASRGRSGGPVFSFASNHGETVDFRAFVTIMQRM